MIKTDEWIIFCCKLLLYTPPGTQLPSGKISLVELAMLVKYAGTIIQMKVIAPYTSRFFTIICKTFRFIIVMQN